MCPENDKNDDWREIPEIYQLLKNGDGWARVSRHNVEALITEAIADGNSRLERELRDWK